MLICYPILVLFITFHTITAASVRKNEPRCNYQNCPQGKPGMLNVHLVCHTHNDVGWLKTVDQYYYGANQSIQRAGVQYILDSVIEQLQHDPEKKFIYVETAFFWRWWSEQPDFKRHQVQKLVYNGQLEFIGGGWSMNDEAATHYCSTIDQMSWGFRRLKEAFGNCGIPRVAWQIDPFGHSKEDASLFAQMFFDGLFLGRIDYQDKDRRMANKTMEFVWKGSNNLGKPAQLFTGVLPNGYSPPPGFCFDILCNDQPIMDDPRLSDMNVEEKVNNFIQLAKEQASLYRTDHTIMTMGMDFHYQSASPWFKNLEKLMHYVNAKQSKGSKVNVFYSTPSCYLYALNKANKTWPTKSDDFFPYSSDPHAYWTGYFTSRPSIKGYERLGNNILQVCKQLDTLAILGPSDNSDVVTLREAMGVMQHHDAVTGTEKQHVSNDYAKRLATGIAGCQDTVSDAYKKLMNKVGKEPPQQIFCNFLNITQCAITEGNDPVAVTIYNPIARAIDTFVRIPVSGKAYKVVGPDGKVLDAQLVPIPMSIKNIPGRESKATSELIFAVQLPQLGYRTYFIRKSGNSYVLEQQRSTTYRAGTDVTIQNKFLEATVDGKTGLLKEVRLTNGPQLTMTQSFYWYSGMAGNNSKFDFRASGAYIFRPNGSEPNPLGGNISVFVVKGDLVQEVHQMFNPWLSQVIRLYKDQEHLEIQWVVGPIPVQDGVGKEIITRFDTPLKTEGKFYTDSNGREILERVRNFRQTWTLNVTEPVSGNYYPVNSRIYIRDDKLDLQLTVLTDRSQGGSSIQDGSMELMIHRRLLHDDAFGVDEALNEPGVDGRGLVIVGKHYLILSNIKDAAPKHRDLAMKLYMAPYMSFSPYTGSEIEWIDTYKTEYSGLLCPLPSNVHLLTLEQWNRGNFLLRLEHFYESSDDPRKLSKPVTVSLENIFSDMNITAVQETTLGANQFLHGAGRLVWKTEDSPEKQLFDGYVLLQTPRVPQFTVTLKPMQIRTFIVSVVPKAAGK